MYPTIAAIATGPAAGGVGILRLSGSRALEAAALVCKRPPSTFTPRQATFTQFVVNGQRIDEGLVLVFRSPASYTGEDVVELHAHGSPRVLKLLLEVVLAHEGVRLAEAGEFTRRAFMAGRLDLARAEAVAELVSAESEAQVRAAAAQLSGDLSNRIQSVTGPLLELRADIEGALDFPDEAEGAEQGLLPRLDEVLVTLEGLCLDGARGALVRRGARVVLYGPVNAGKSTLFNRLSGAERAIVDAEPGTTRDALEVRVEVSGLGVTLVDTAGLRDAPGRIEAIGIERTRAALAAADVAVLVLPPDASAAQRMAWRAEVPDTRRLDVEGKADLGPGCEGEASERVSGLTGEGVARLRDRMSHYLGASAASAASAVSERHLDCLKRAREALQRARQALSCSTLEVVGGEVGVAMQALHDITGVDASTELLDAIFARFCIGK